MLSYGIHAAKKTIQILLQGLDQAGLGEKIPLDCVNKRLGIGNYIKWWNQ